jgi:hypothetical protein
MPDPWTTAWEEAEASAPPGVLIYSTLELQHPAFLQGEPPVQVPIRVVTGVSDDTVFGIELGATFDPGAMVTFQAVPFYSERPEFAEGKVPEVQIQIDNIGREILGYLDAAVQIKADLITIYREYRSDDLTEPCYGPIQFVMRKVKVGGTLVVGTARLDDLANRRFPFKSYTINEFPGLLS